MEEALIMLNFRALADMFIGSSGERYDCTGHMSINPPSFGVYINGTALLLDSLVLQYF